MAYTPPTPSSSSNIRLNCLEEFPALSTSATPLRRCVTEPAHWKSLFPSKSSPQTIFSTAQTPSAECSSPLRNADEAKASPADEHSSLAWSPTECIPSSQHAEVPQAYAEKDCPLASPTRAEHMSIKSADTTETRGTTGGETPWDSSTLEAMKESISSVHGDEATIGLPAPDGLTKQGELLPAFDFSEVRPCTPPNQLISNIISSPEGGNHHDTPSFIQGPIKLRQVISADPHRIIHAIKHMMRNVAELEKMAKVPAIEVEQRQKERAKMMADTERYLEEVRKAKVITETRRAETASTMENERNSMKFNPSAVSCSFSSGQKCQR